MKKVVIVFFVLIIFIPLLSGCWNQKELTDLAFVMAMGVDKGKNKKFEVSFQMVNPGNVSSGQGGGGGQGLPIAVFKSEGDTLTEAARNATKVVSRRLYYAHTNLVVISEEVAKKDMLLIIDALDRDPEFRTTVEMVIARGSSASDLVSTLTILDKLPVKQITKQIQTSEKMLGENISIKMDDFLSGLISNGRNPILNGYSLIGNKAKASKTENLDKTTKEAFLAADGLAAFKKGKLVGWIEDENARGIIWVLDKMNSTDISVNWKGKKKAITVAPIRSKTKISVHINNGKPTIDVAIENESWVSEANAAIDLTNPEVIQKIEKLVEKETKKQVTASIKAAQKLKCDIFGFGEHVHRANPKLWKTLQKNWDEEFAGLRVNVEIDSYIRREGIRTKPFWSDFS